MPDDYRDALLGPPRPAPDLAAIRARRAAITPGPWVAEQAITADHTVHWEIRTQAKLPEHPWSPRFIAWMTGLVSDNPPASPIQVCPECHTARVQRRRLEVPIDVRWDTQLEADAAFIAAAPADIDTLLAEVDRLRIENAALNVALDLADAAARDLGY